LAEPSGVDAVHVVNCAAEVNVDEVASLAQPARR
jgi:hypothetical protein